MHIIIGLLNFYVFQMKIEPRVTEPAEGHFYFKLFSQELIYIDIPLPVEQESKKNICHSTLKVTKDNICEIFQFLGK